MQRKIIDDEMLITHRPPDPKDMSERVGPAEIAAVASEMDPKSLAARLAATTDSEERKRLIADIQERLGNKEAERIVESVRKAEEK
jgi:hypothetical protein